MPAFRFELTITNAWSQLAKTMAFTVSGLAREQADGLLDIIVQFHEAQGYDVNGGIAEVSENDGAADGEPADVAPNA